MIKKLKFYNSLNWLQIAICIVIVISITISLLAMSEATYLSLFLIILLEINVSVFINFTYIKYGKALLNFVCMGFYAWVDNIRFSNYLLDSLYTGSNIMKVSKNISCISIAIWLISYIINYGTNMYDVKLFAGLIFYIFLMLRDDEVFMQIFSNKETWANPNITPLKHLRRMIRGN